MEGSAAGSWDSPLFLQLQDQTQQSDCRPLILGGRELFGPNLVFSSWMDVPPITYAWLSGPGY